MDDLISVIVPVYNSERFLNSCIDSIIHQTYENLEIILIDDGSTDNSFSICKNYAERDKRIKVFHKENSGPADTRNVGLDNASGRYVAFVDSDDILNIDAYKIIMEIKSNLKNPSISVGVNYNRFTNDNPHKRVSSFNYPQKAFSPDNFARHQGGYYLWGFLYDNEIIQSKGLRLESELDYLEDVVFNSIYYRFIDKVIYVDLPLYYYRININSITHTKVDHKLLAYRWMISYESIVNSACRIVFNDSQIKGIKKELRMCMNNIHSELYAQKESYTEYKKIVSVLKKRKRKKYDLFIDYYINKKKPWFSYMIYKLLFLIRN